MKPKLPPAPPGTYWNELDDDWTLRYADTHEPVPAEDTPVGAIYGQLNTTPIGWSDPVSDPEVRARRTATLRSTLSPEIRAKLSAAQREVAARPGESERRSARATASFSRPEVKAKLSASFKEAYDKPGAREKKGASLRDIQARPEVKAKIRAARKARMSDPAERAKAAANLKAGRAKPSWRANVAAAMRARSKLTIDKVRQIHVMAAAGALHKDIANALGVGRTTVTAILRGVNWSDVWLEFNPGGTPKSAKP